MPTTNAGQGEPACRWFYSTPGHHFQTLAKVSSQSIQRGIVLAGSPYIQIDCPVIATSKN